MSEFCKEKSLSIESDYVNRNEMKRIDNQLEKGFSSEFDKLNESLYKINSFLKLSKDIEEMKKDNLVKNDIQRKLSLKSQWLNSSHGSTASLNSLPPTSLKNISGPGSTQSLCKSETKKENDLSKKRKNFANFKSQSVQNVNVVNERPVRRLGKRSTCTSFDELNFVDKLRLSDEDVSRLSAEPEFEDTKGGLSRVDELKNRIDSQSVSQGSSVHSSQRDLSRFFPKKETKQITANVNKNQKELKDVDLSKYFLPSPVQGMKSLPSPGSSPNLPRKPLTPKSNDDNTPSTSSLLRTAIDNLQKINKCESLDQSNEPKIEDFNLRKVKKSESLDHSNEPKREDFTLRDHQLDGEVSFKKPTRVSKLNLGRVSRPQAPYSGYESIPLDDENGVKDDCEMLFASMKSPIGDIDELFDKVAADILPEAPKPKPIDKVPKKSQPQKTVRKVAEPKPVEPKKVEIKYDLAPSSKFVCDPIKRESDILSKLSSNLLNEIKLLEQHLKMNDGTNEKKEEKKEVPKAKKAKKDKKLIKPAAKCIDDAKVTQTEEELNSAIDDILNSVSIKEDILPQIVPKKLTHVTLPKASKGTKSEISSFSNPEFMVERKLEKEAVNFEKIRTAPEQEEVLQDSKKSEDTVDASVDFVFKPKTRKIEEKAPEPLIRSSEMVQRVASIEQDLATFMVNQSIPSVDDIRPLQKPVEKQVIEPSPPIEKVSFSFTAIDPVKRQEPEVKVLAKRPPSKERDFIASKKASDEDMNQSRQPTFNQEQKIKPTEVAQTDLSKKNSPPKEKPSVNQLVKKLTTNEKERPSIENELLTARKPLTSKTYKVHLPFDEPEPKRQHKLAQEAPPRENERSRKPSFDENNQSNAVKKGSQAPDVEMKPMAFVQPVEEKNSTPKRKNSIKNNTEIQAPVLKQEPVLRKRDTDQSDVVSYKPRKSLVNELNIAQQSNNNIESASKSSPDNARKSFFADPDSPSIRPERSSEKRRKQSFESHIRFDQNNQSSECLSATGMNRAQNEPPVKPARRRSRKSSCNEASGDEQVITRKNEPSPTTSRKHISLPNKEDHNLHTNNLKTMTDDLERDAIPSLKNISHILESHKSPENEIEIVNDYPKPIENVGNQTNAFEVAEAKTDETEYHDRRFDPPEYQEKCEHRLSGSGDYDNVPTSSSRRVKLADTRKQSRSFDTSCDVDRDYDNVNANVGRRSVERPSPSPTVSSLDRKKNVTDMLLERSKNLHHKKQEFMNDKLTESNPYIRRMMEKESRFRPGYERSRHSPLSSSSHYTQPYSSSISRPLPSTTTATSSPLSYHPRSTAPSSSSSRGVLDMFRNPTSSNKDSCTIS